MDVGIRLREARLQRGVTLHDLSTVTKISIYMLEAIERNDLACLPGGLYRRAYLRAYAAEVGVNPEQIVREYLGQVESAEEPAEVPARGATSDTRTIRWQRVTRRVFGYPR